MRTYKTISCSVTGYRKKLDNLQCEDATKVLQIPRGTIIAVADGHGDKRCLFASIGAKLAVKASCDILKLYLKSAEDDVSTYWNSRRREIAMDIAKTFAFYALADYSSRCKDHITRSEVLELQQHICEYFRSSEEAISPAELREKYLNKKKLGDKLSRILFLYGTTVRASVLTDAYLFNCALGDGDTIAVINDRVEWLLPQAEAFECETASLCESFETIVDSFVFSFVECRATRENGNDNISDTSVFAPMVMLATDGFRNSFFSPSLVEKKVKDIGESACLNKREVRVANLKLLYEKLSKESVFQDDISTVIAVRTKKI